MMFLGFHLVVDECAFDNYCFAVYYFSEGFDYFAPKIN